MRESKCVVFVVGDTQGWGWEVEEAARLGVLDKCLFVVPPVPAEESARRLAHLESALGMRLMDHLDTTAGTLLVTVPTDRARHVIVADVTDDCAYRTALLART